MLTISERIPQQGIVKGTEHWTKSHLLTAVTSYFNPVTSFVGP